MFGAGNAGDQLDREVAFECGQLQLLGNWSGVESQIRPVPRVCTHGWGFSWVCGRSHPNDPSSWPVTLTSSTGHSGSEIRSASLPIPDTVLWDCKRGCEWHDYDQARFPPHWIPSSPSDTRQLRGPLGIPKHGR